MRLSQFVGQAEARLGLMLNAIDPRCGGLLLVGRCGSGKSTLARLYRGLLPSATPFVELPLNATEESVLGVIDLERTLADGERILQPGLLARVHGGALLVDDVNLLSPEVLCLVMEAQARGALLVERDGVSLQTPCHFLVLATMNPLGGVLSPHVIDRFGLCAEMEVIDDPAQRMEVMRLADGARGARGLSLIEPDATLQRRVAAGRALLPSVKWSSEAQARLAEVVRRNPSPGHRGDLYLYRAAGALAALEQEGEVVEEHVERVVALVFRHRRIELQAPPDPVPDSPPPDEPGEEGERSPHQGPSPERPADRGAAPQGTAESPEGAGEDDPTKGARPSQVREEVLPVGAPFRVRRLTFEKDRLERRASGRRTVTRAAGRGGRYVKSLLQSTNRDIAIDATLRACAPLQRVRGRQGRLLIEESDLRFRRREKRMGHLVLFVVDGSGSMGARRRMVETKGAIQSFLSDCYQKRDKVALIVFRKDRAELVLPPTSSVALAARRLAALPVGGKTPLSAGLLQAEEVVKQVRLRDPRTRVMVVLVTDGRGNHSLSRRSPLEETRAAAARLGALPACDFVVIDTEDEHDLLRTRRAQCLASDLAAEYFTIDALHAERLARVLLEKTALAG